MAIFFASNIFMSCNKAEVELDSDSMRKAHIELLTTMFLDNGWIIDDGATQEEIEEFLLSLEVKDVEEFHKFIYAGDKISTDVKYVESFSSQMLEWGDYEMKAYLTGFHSSYFANARTYMTIGYDRSKLYVLETKVSSHPSTDWYPEVTPTYYFHDNVCNIVVYGTIRWGHFLRRMEMTAYVVLAPNSLVIEAAEINHFREA